MIQWTWDLYNEKKVWFDQLPVRKDREQAAHELADAIAEFRNVNSYMSESTGSFFDDLAIANRELERVKESLVENDTRPENILPRIAKLEEAMKAELPTIRVADVEGLQEQLKETAGKEGFENLQKQIVDLRKQLEGLPTKPQYEAFAKQVSDEIAKLRGEFKEEVAKAKVDAVTEIKLAAEKILEGMPEKEKASVRKFLQAVWEWKPKSAEESEK